MLVLLFLLASFQPQVATPKSDIVVWPHGVSPLGIKHTDDFGNHGLSITVHDTSCIAEVHQTTADVMIVQSGEATLVYGGEVIEPQFPKPNEIRGSGIRNGNCRHVEAGDVVHLPAGTPHQWIIEPGKHIIYLVVHIEVPPAKP
jgi:mannose-6-phosphate isomerase-like protein (cupin superfamily)